MRDGDGGPSEARWSAEKAVRIFCSLAYRLFLPYAVVAGVAYRMKLNAASRASPILGSREIALKQMSYVFEKGSS